MRALIIIIILAIIAYGIYRNLKIKDEASENSGVAGATSGKEHEEHHGEDIEPRPDDEDHEDGTHE